MSIVVRRYLGRSRLAESLVEDVQIVAHRNAIFAKDVEELVVECIELEKMSKHTWAYVLEKLFSDTQMDDIDEIGHMMRTASTKIVDVFERVKVLIDSATAFGHSIHDSSDFLIARREVEKIKEDVEEKFPSVDKEMVKQSLEAYKHGNYRSAEDLLRESQGQSP